MNIRVEVNSKGYHVQTKEGYEKAQAHTTDNNVLALNNMYYVAFHDSELNNKTIEIFFRMSAKLNEHTYTRIVEIRKEDKNRKMRRSHATVNGGKYVRLINEIAYQIANRKANELIN